MDPLSETETETAQRKPARRAAKLDAEARLVAALRRREDEAYLILSERHHNTMIRIALPLVGTRELAEEVAQEVWAAMWAGIDTFEGRSSLRSWLYGILFRRARSIARKEKRSIPASQLIGGEADSVSEELDRLFHSPGHPDAGAWAVPLQRWSVSPEDRLIANEMQRSALEAIDRLPEPHRSVVILKDTEGWETKEIAELLGHTANWVRVVLHRGRVKARQAVAEHFEGAKS
jgi:RNA polymerase sigma-70 factor (ECF subfamily)